MMLSNVKSLTPSVGSVKASGRKAGSKTMMDLRRGRSAFRERILRTWSAFSAKVIAQSACLRM